MTEARQILELFPPGRAVWHNECYKRVADIDIHERRSKLQRQNPAITSAQLIVDADWRTKDGVRMLRL
jgi:hypothetical protein